MLVAQEDNGSIDFVSGLPPAQRASEEEHLRCVSPADGKYWKDTKKLVPYLSAEAEWRAFAKVQRILLETRAEMGQATKEQAAALAGIEDKVSPLNMAYLEDLLRHDQLAVIEEIGRVAPDVKHLLHPGTTSYDIVDTARAHLFKTCWEQVMRPKIKEAIFKLADKAEKYVDTIQVGRTHLQNTSPISFGGYLAGYARRMNECVQECDRAFGSLKGKISSISGTGAGIEAVIGQGKALDFEEKVLKKLGLEPDLTASQITQKEGVVRAAHGIAVLMAVTANFANDMRFLYSSAIGEVTDRDSKARLGGSSADAGKNNPINWENIAGKYAIVQSGLAVVYAQIDSNLGRDLRNSVQARSQPQEMMAHTYESFCRLSKSLDTLAVNEETMSRNLIPVRQSPTEALTAIMRAHQYIHPKFGVGHDAVKKFGIAAQKEGKPLMEIALADVHFKAAFDTWPDAHKEILSGKLEQYLGAAKEKARLNIIYARNL